MKDIIQREKKRKGGGRREREEEFRSGRRKVHYLILSGVLALLT